MNFKGYKLEKLFIFINITRLFGIIFIWSLQIILIYEKGLSYLLSESAVFMPIGLNITVIGTITVIKFNTIQYTIEYIRKLISSHKESWEFDIVNNELKSATKLVNIFKTFLYLFAIFYVILPFVIDVIRASLGYDNPYKVPLPLDGYLEKIIKRNSTYFITAFLSYFWFMLTVTNYIAFQSLVFYLVSYANGEMKIIKRKFELLSDNGKIINNDWNLKSIIINHQRLIRLIELQKECVGMQLSFQNSISSGTLCLVLYLANKSFSSDTILFGFCSIFLIFLTVLFIIICNQGESIQSESEEMFTSICNTSWFTQKYHVKKDYNLIIMQAKRPLVYDYKGISPINRAAFMLVTIFFIISYHLLLFFFALYVPFFLIPNAMDYI
ncbi:hypothetical protein O3M35_006481 [Rhynocoris fuscipes]|uniref:Odorant receptor n=1 Tax=Rhynocoris fuscipes TaxID=488301 RepID=A0AAW1DDP3_9HEMI